MNEISTVSAITQEALVRFLLRLEGKELPFSEPHDEDYSTDEMPSVQDDLKRPHAHQPYEISTSARERIRNDLLDEIIIPLFRMDDRPTGYASLWKDSSSIGNEAVSPQVCYYRISFDCLLLTLPSLLVLPGLSNQIFSIF
jgi:hypothetical protein